MPVCNWHTRVRPGCPPYYTRALRGRVGRPSFSVRSSSPITLAASILRSSKQHRLPISPVRVSGKSSRVSCALACKLAHARAHRWTVLVLSISSFCQLRPKSPLNQSNSLFMWPRPYTIDGRPTPDSAFITRNGGGRRPPPL